jgi:hexosaminidase
MISFLLFGSCSTAKRQISIAGELENIDNYFPINATIKWKLITNNYLGKSQSLAELSIINNSDHNLGKNWQLHFNYAPGRNILNGHEEIIIEHINGDFFRMIPGESFSGLAAGKTMTVPVISSAWITKESEVPGGFYFATKTADDSLRIDIPVFESEPLSVPAHVKRHSDDNIPYPTAEQRFVENIRFDNTHPVMLNRIIPSPYSSEKIFSRSILTAEYRIYFEAELKSEAEFLRKSLEQNLGSRLNISEGYSDEPNTIILRTGSVIIDEKNFSTGSESYELSIQKGAIRITGTDPAGVLYGIQSLRALLPVETYAQPTARIILDDILVKDKPRFAYRGLHLDVARNFHPKSSIMRILDMMAFYKMNKFHFHLTDDEGWRLEIPGIPELTEIASKRGHTTDENDMLIPAYGSGPFPDPSLSYGTGYYSIDDFTEILRYANERHIEVIPEIDMPGHARAAIVAMKARYHNYMRSDDPLRAEMFLLSDWQDTSDYRSVHGFDDNVICVCCNSTYLFLETVINGIISMYQKAGAPLTTIHIGGDEVPHGVWEKSPVCANLQYFNPELKNSSGLKEYFISRINEILQRKNLITAGWEEIGIREHFSDGKKIREANPNFLNRDFRIHSWNSVYDYGGIETGYMLANAGYKLVMSNVSPFYLDMAYDKDPLEPGFYWGGYINEEKIYSFDPFDVYNSVKTDLNGNPVSRSILAGKTKLTEKGRENIIGIQAQLWTETVKTQKRMDYMLFPRLILVAERAWAKEPEWIKDPPLYDQQWNHMANVIGKRELPRMDHLHDGFSYRIPVPGAVLKDGLLIANSFPGFELRYTSDGTEPDITSPKYISPVNVGDAEIRIRAFASNGRAGRSIIVKQK